MHLKRHPKLKHLATLAVFTFAIVGVVAMARTRSEESASQEEGAEDRSAYVEQVEGQLEDWEKQLDEFRGQQRQYDSIENYMLADDLELLMKDIRGDLDKLQTMHGDGWQRLHRALEAKLFDLRSSLAQVTEPAIGRTAINKE